MLKLLNAFKRNQDGQILILAAVMLPLLLMVAGGALDYAIMLTQKTKDQHAIDTAVLAAAKSKLPKSQFPTESAQQAERIRIFNQMFDTNASGLAAKPNFTFNFEEGGMKVTATNKSRNSFLGMFGNDAMNFETSTGAAYTKNGTFEIVIIFDSTGSMGGIIGTVKSNAVKFTPDILVRLQEKGVLMEDIQTKVISYKDYWADSLPMNESRFYNLPTEQAEFKSFVNVIEASGGGDAPESGLEAINLAMQSVSPDREENAPANKLIVLWTDISAIPLEGKAGNGRPSGYPANMPGSLAQMKSRWDDSPTTELLIFGPSAYPWGEIQGWERVTHIVGNPNSVAYSTVIDKIAEAMTNFSGLRLIE